MATDPLSNFRSSQFVSQYKGLPIEAFQQTANVLQQRELANKAAMDKLDMLAYQTDVYGKDEAIKQAQIQKIREDQERIAAAGAYANASDIVRMQGKEFAQNSALNQARSNYKAIQTGMTEAAKHSPAQQKMFELALSQYEGVGEPNELGKYNKFSYSFHEDPDLNKAIDDFVDDWKADETAWVQKHAGYIKTGGTKKVDEKEVRRAAVRMLLANPEYQRAIRENANLQVYNRTGNLNDMAGNPADYELTYTVKDKDGKDVEYKTNMLEQYLGELVDPYAARESFEQDRLDLKGDSTWGAMFEKQASNVIPMVVPGSTINDYGTLDYDQYKEQLTASQNAIVGLEEQLSQVSQENNPGKYKEIQQQIDVERNKQRDLLKLKEDYNDKVNANSSDADKNRLNLFNETEMLPDLPNVYKGTEEENALIDKYIAAARKIFGSKIRGYSFDDPYDRGDVLASIKYARMRGRRLATETYFGGDFSDFLKERTEQTSRTPNILSFGPESKETLQMTNNAIINGNLEVFASDTKKDDKNQVAAVNAVRALAVAGDLNISGATLDQEGRAVVTIGGVNLDDKKYANLDSDTKDFIEKASESNQQFYVGFLGTSNPMSMIVQQERTNLEEYVNSQQMMADNGFGAVNQNALQTLNTLRFNDIQQSSKRDIEEALNTGLEKTISIYDPSNNMAFQGDITIVRASDIDNKLLKVKRPNGTFVTGADGKVILYSQEQLYKTYFGGKK